MRPTAEVRPGCSAMPWAMTFAALRQCGDAGIAAADAAAADGDQQIAAVGHQSVGDRRGIATRGLGADNFGADGARAFRDQLCRCDLPRSRGDIDDAQPGTAHLERFAVPPRARPARSSARNRLSGRDKTSRGDIAADPPNPLPRNRFRQYLRPAGPTGRRHRNRPRNRNPQEWHRRPRPRPVVSPAAAACRTTRRRDRGPAAPSHRRRRCCGRDRGECGHLRRDEAERLRQRQFDRRHRRKIAQQGGKRRIERRKRSRQALGEVRDEVMRDGGPRIAPLATVPALAGAPNFAGPISRKYFRPPGWIRFWSAAATEPGLVANLDEPAAHRTR